MDASELGRQMQALRKNRRGGGSTRRVAHDPTKKSCRCVDCRKARGQYPAHLLDKKKTPQNDVKTTPRLIPPANSLTA